MQRQVVPSNIARLHAITILLTLSSTSAFAQVAGLDDGWTVKIGGQTVLVEPNGSFFIPNIASPDRSPTDFVGDDFLLLTGTNLSGPTIQYLYSNKAFQTTPGGTFALDLSRVIVTSTPPPVPESIVVESLDDAGLPSLTFAVGESRKLKTTVTLSGGTTIVASLPGDWTSYRTSNAGIVELVYIPDYTSATEVRIQGNKSGTAFITATNGGATSVIRITVANPGDLVSTSVEGFVMRGDGQRIANAAIAVKLPTSGIDGEPGSQLLKSGVTDANGFFSLAPVAVPADPASGVGLPIVVQATVITSSIESRTSPLLVPVADGITDVGIITIDTMCDTPWSPAFRPATFDATLAGNVNIFAIAAFDEDDSGPNSPALFVGGQFGTAGGTAVNNIAKWDGAKYVPLGSGMFAGFGEASVHALETIDLDGPGGDPPALYAGGKFETAGGVLATNIAKWDGINWSPLGGGVGDTFFSVVIAIAAYDDGTGNGTELYAGGFFAVAGGLDVNGMCLPENGCVDAYSIAKWNPTTQAWSAVGDGVQPGINTGPVNALAVFDADGPGGAAPLLYVGGDFASSTTVPTSNAPTTNIVKWDGVSWMGVGFDGLPGGVVNKVTSLLAFDDGSGVGTALYVGGTFIDARNFGDPSPVTVPLRNIARWNGSVWSALRNSLDREVLALAGFANGVDPPILYASGSFGVIGGAATGVKQVAQWNGVDWLPMGKGIESNGTALVVFDDGTGSALYVGDGVDCATGGEVFFNKQGYIAKWDAPDWSVLGKGLNDEVQAMVVHDDGSGAALFAAGLFTPPKGPCDSNESLFAGRGVGRFDGVEWSSLGAGMNCNGIGCVTSVNALAVFDDDGPLPGAAHLFAGGEFDSAGIVGARNLARWNGSDWSALAGGGVDGAVEALAVFDDGVSGPALVVGGSFTTVGATLPNTPGPTSANNIARWNGADWSALSGGVTGGSVLAMTTFDDGSGPQLYVGGNFIDADGLLNTSFIAQWDGSTWSAVGGGVSAIVYVLTVFDDGTGPALYVGGEFLSAKNSPLGSDVTVNRIAKWNGVAWSPLNIGLGPSSGAAQVDTLSAFDNGEGLRLYAGGDFTTALTSGGSTTPLNRLAKWNPTLGEWSAVGVSSQPGSDPGGGVDGTGTVAIQSLAVFDDGFNGPALFAGGAFETANGTPSSNIAKLGCR